MLRPAPSRERALRHTAAAAARSRGSLSCQQAALLAHKPCGALRPHRGQSRPAGPDDNRLTLNRGQNCPGKQNKHRTHAEAGEFNIFLFNYCLFIILFWIFKSLYHFLPPLLFQHFVYVLFSFLFSTACPCFLSSPLPLPLSHPSYFFSCPLIPFVLLSSFLSLLLSISSPCFLPSSVLSSFLLPFFLISCLLLLPYLTFFLSPLFFLFFPFSHLLLHPCVLLSSHSPSPFLTYPCLSPLLTRFSVSSSFLLVFPAVFFSFFLSLLLSLLSSSLSYPFIFFLLSFHLVFSSLL